MRKPLLILIVILPLIFLDSCSSDNSLEIPFLKQNGEANQLIVDGKPFLILGGELHNSSSSSRDYMKKFWPELEASGMNTVLAAVEWSLVEPEEGLFDYTIIDNLLEDARAHNLRLILLWFGSWKNSQSAYIPDWIKSDYNRFPRVKASFGKSLEILSPFYQESLNADTKAFANVMKHLREVDSEYRTVIMMQVENEVGILGSARDHSPAAETAFNSSVPRELIDHLVKHKANLFPGLNETWKASDYKTSGTWEDLFGSNGKADEIFMAWNYSRYINSIAKAGKAEYPLPMFVNAWLVQKSDKIPGDYPSGGPQAHMLDIWKAGSPDLDLYVPDIYRPEFAELCDLYTHNDNTLFIPEARAGELGAAQFFYAIGKHKSIGYSPFGFEARTQDIENDPVTIAYKIASGMAPLILEAQSRGTITSVLLNTETKPLEEIVLGDYKLIAEIPDAPPQPLPFESYGIIMNPAPDEYIIYGKDIQFSFLPVTPGPAIAGIAHVDEGIFDNGKWIPGRRLNGDEIFLDIDLAARAVENKTGTGIKFYLGNEKIQWVKLYRYE